MPKIPHLRIKIRRHFLPTLLKLVIRRDGHQQHYHVLPDAAAEEEQEHGRPPEQMTMPGKRLFTTGSLEQRLSAITSYLRTNFPSARGHLAFSLAATRDQQETVAKLVNRPWAHLSQMAFYDPGTHRIFLFSQTIELLESEDERARAAGVRIMFHEWFHGMRAGGVSYSPAEEGLAEAFARTLMERALGLDPEERNIRTYVPLRMAMQEIGEAALGVGNMFEFAKASRKELDQKTWFYNELDKLSVPHVEIAAIMKYSSSDDLVENRKWLRKVRDALKGR